MHLPYSPTAVRFTPALFVVLLLPPIALAQQPGGRGLGQPRLLVVSPAGGQAGSAFEVTLIGNDFDAPENLLFSHPGIKADRLSDATTTRPPQGNQPALMSCKFKVTIPADVSPGTLDVRLAGRFGVSNPRAFEVGNLPEIVEKEPNNDVPEAQLMALNSTAHGTIGAPTDVDYYRFSGRKGQRVVISCLASSLDSRLHAAVELYGAGGDKLGFNRNYRGTDALLDAVLPADGDYLIRVFAFAYLQGGLEYFYRLTVSTGPWLDAAFPPLVEPGKPNKVTLFGRNLPGGTPDPAAVIDGRPLERLTVTVTPPTDPQARTRLTFNGHIPPVSAALDGFEYRLRGAIGSSNPVLLAYADAPLVLDAEGNDTAEGAQDVTLPCEIAGRIEKKRDRDWFRFTANKGDVYSIELYGDRLGSPVDLYAVLRSARGQVGAEMDDNPEPVSNQFFNRSDDPPRYRFVVPESGSYLLMVTSRESDIDASPRHLYRVRITPERPDFRLVVMPPSPTFPDVCTVRRGGSQAYAVFVSRQDGFAGDIALTVEGLPKGVTCPPQTISAGMRQALLVVTAAADAPLGGAEVRVKGTANIDGRTVVREARPASITWPLPQGQNAPTISRLDRGLMLVVSEQGPFSLTAEVPQTKVKAGDRVTVSLKLARNWSDFKAPVQITALGLPPNAQLQPQQFAIAADRKDGSVTLNLPSNVTPGVYTIVLRGQAQFQYSQDPKSRQRTNVTVIEPATPITLTVLPRDRR